MNISFFTNIKNWFNQKNATSDWDGEEIIIVVLIVSLATALAVLIGVLFGSI